MNGQYQAGDVVLGNWTLVRLLGEGSYGKVYEAHREDFGTTYKAAIKIMTIPQSQSEVASARAEGMDEESVTAYFRSFVEDVVQEFALMSKLKGTANIVSYEDHSVVPHTTGIGWDILIRMELLTPMLSHMEQRKMTRSDVIKLGIDMCRALELCQRYNIIHRDIKPENIFISETGDYKLGDFGVARTLERTTGGLSKKGTYTYMAPEIYRDEKYGSTVDIYSLGIVLYRLLNNNRAPFLPASPKPITHSERERALVRRIGGEALPNPANAEGRLAEIVLKACAYEPKDRYTSPLQMRQELEAIQYRRAEDAAIYGRSGQIDVNSADYTRRDAATETEETVYRPRRAEAEESTVYVPGREAEEEAGTVREEKQRDTKPLAAPARKKKGGLIAGLLAAAALLGVLGFFLLPGRGQPERTDAAAEKTESAEPAPEQTPAPESSEMFDGLALPDGSIADAIHSHGQFLAAGPYQTACLRNDGTVEVAVDPEYTHLHLDSVDNWKGIAGVAAAEYWTFGIRGDGSVLVSAYGFYDESGLDAIADEVSRWDNIVKLECDGGHSTTVMGSDTLTTQTYHVVGLRYDGTVIATGDDRYGECLVSDWRDIVDVAAGWRHTVGLKTDGTVLAVGSNEDGQCNVSDWRDIVQVAAARYCTVGLRADGSILIAGNMGYGQYMPQLTGMNDVRRIFACCDLGTDSDFVLAVMNDGTARIFGSDEWGMPVGRVEDALLCVGSPWGYLAYLDSAGSAFGLSAGNQRGDREGSPIWTDLMLPDTLAESYEAEPMHWVIAGRDEASELRMAASPDGEVAISLRDLRLEENDGEGESFWEIQIFYQVNEQNGYTEPIDCLIIDSDDYVRQATAMDRHNGKENAILSYPLEEPGMFQSTGQYVEIQRDGSLFTLQFSMPRQETHPADEPLYVSVFFLGWDLTFDQTTVSSLYMPGDLSAAPAVAPAEFFSSAAADLSYDFAPMTFTAIEPPAAAEGELTLLGYGVSGDLPVRKLRCGDLGMKVDFTFEWENNTEIAQLIAWSCSDTPYTLEQINGQAAEFAAEHGAKVEGADSASVSNRAWAAFPRAEYDPAYYLILLADTKGALCGYVVFETGIA